MCNMIIAKWKTRDKDSEFTFHLARGKNYYSCSYAVCNSGDPSECEFRVLNDNFLDDVFIDSTDYLQYQNRLKFFFDNYSTPVEEPTENPT